MLCNDDGLWWFGVVVKVCIVVVIMLVVQVVLLLVLQSMDGKDVVFVCIVDIYIVCLVMFGVCDVMQVEVLLGLMFGEDVVVEQSYVVKVDIGKVGVLYEY